MDEEGYKAARVACASSIELSGGEASLVIGFISAICSSGKLNLII
jgi:hypothetical protein